MGKYYVQSGQLQVVIAGPHIENPKSAACEALLQYLPHGIVLAPLILISERGFDWFNHHTKEDDFVFATVDILKLAGMLEDENEY